MGNGPPVVIAGATAEFVTVLNDAPAHATKAAARDGLVGVGRYPGVSVIDSHKPTFRYQSGFDECIGEYFDSYDLPQCLILVFTRGEVP